ncbi:hypothetical protein HK104_002168 [Borealophlyctis nickersoniae]|nr:hypothetical protein HK104_002168 [Borealophlyctis nickersoniae]
MNRGGDYDRLDKRIHISPTTGRPPWRRALLLSSPRFRWAAVALTLLVLGYTASSTLVSVRDTKLTDAGTLGAWDRTKIYSGGGGGGGGDGDALGTESEAGESGSGGGTVFKNMTSTKNPKTGPLKKIESGRGGTDEDDDDEEPPKVTVPSGTDHTSWGDFEVHHANVSRVVKKKWDKYAFALKSGQETALDRAPMQLMTFLRDVRNLVIIGETPNMRVGDFEVADVFTDLYTELDKKNAEKESEKKKLVTQFKKVEGEETSGKADGKKGSEEQAGAKGSGEKKREENKKGEQAVSESKADPQPASGNAEIRNQNHQKREMVEDDAVVINDIPILLARTPATPEPDRRLFARADAPVRKEKDNGEAVKVDNTAQGWRADAHKNLPGFRELWKRFPNAEWYMMIDDDSYVFLDNLEHFLKTYDPNQPHYLGSKTLFIGCDGIKKFGTGPYFAHGGSGIILSRAAMKVLISGLDACIEKYRTCWAGDVRTALCLRDHGILLEYPGGFHRDPPNDRFHFPKNPCDRPLTFHHLLVKQLQKLYDLETSVRNQRNGDGHVKFADIFADWHKGLPEGGKPGTDRPRGDYEHMPTATAQDCESLCTASPKCMSFTFDGAMCWLKHSIPPADAKEGVTSGVMTSRYKCLSDL